MQSVARRRFLIASALGVIGLIAWAALWFTTIRYGVLPFGDRMWFKHPFFGADFLSQSGQAAKIWLSGADPYANRPHLLPYPPLVIRLFLWVDLFSLQNALEVWFGVGAAIGVAAAVVAHETRRKLDLPVPPLTLSVFAVVASYPFLFQLERGNCDLITVASILVALPLLARRGRATEFLAGAVLSIGPWVKFYPGLMGFGLLALRRPWAVLGFAAGGAAIFLSMLGETKRSFEVLGILTEQTRWAAARDPFPTWSHSLSHAWILLAGVASRVRGLWFFTRIPEVAVAAGAVIVAILPVCIGVFRRRDTGALTYPVLLWICAVASCVPIIANDYSLVFYPLAVVACFDARDPWPARLGILASLVFWQPFLLPVSPWVVLGCKLLGLAAVGVSLWQRVLRIGPPESPLAALRDITTGSPRGALVQGASIVAHPCTTDTPVPGVPLTASQVAGRSTT